jgi:ribose 5-phosphate isomerase A
VPGTPANSLNVNLQMSTMASNDVSPVNRSKEAAANFSATLLENGMVVGLGSGTTATLGVAAIGRRVQRGLKIIGIPTSEQTAEEARGLGIPLSTLGSHPRIDIAIDGADEVETGTLNLIKGGGGNLLREKIVAVASLRFIIIVDDTKVVAQLGSRAPIPVEVAQFGWQTTAIRLQQLGGNPTLRLHPDGTNFVTDGGNYILDCVYGPIQSPQELQRQLDGTVGVMEHGLFIGMASQVIIGGPEGIKLLQRELITKT